MAAPQNAHYWHVFNHYRRYTADDAEAHRLTAAYVAGNAQPNPVRARTTFAPLYITLGVILVICFGGFGLVGVLGAIGANTPDPAPSATAAANDVNATPSADATSASATPTPSAAKPTTRAPSPPASRAAAPPAGNNGGGSSHGGGGSANGGGSCPADHYINSDGHCVPRPVQAPAPPPGATAQCNDGSYSFSEHHQGTCSHHGGVRRWL